MATCYKCGGEIEFYHNGFNAVPIHVSGSCLASSGYGSRGWVERETESGQHFIFGWIEYPSYVNPNAKCPVCGEDVYFYQSPYGGRVFFDDLGPPWPKHPCTSSDDSSVRRIVRDFKIEQLFPALDQQTEASPQPEESKPKIDSSPNLPKSNPKIPEWRKAGWNPLLLTKAESTGGGIILDCNELMENSENIERKLIQVNIQDTFHESHGGLVFSYSMTMNPNRLISALKENVVFIRKISDMTYELSTILITNDADLIHFTFQMKEKFHSQ